MTVTTRGTDLAIVDAHHHLIDLERLRYPWIERRSPVLEALLSNYYDIARDYGLDAYRGDIADPRVVASIACEFGAADGVAEAQWVQARSVATGWPSAFVGAVDLTSPRLSDVLARYRDLPVVRAVRQPLYWSEDPLKRLGARPDFLVDPQWWRGFERVAEAGFVWDLLVYDEQLPAALELVRAFPSTTIVLEAAGWPVDLGPDGFRRWEERLHAASELSNVVLKLQGLALLFGPDRDAVEPWVRTAVQVFGADRCMFATHWPVDRLIWSFDDLLSTLLAILHDQSADQRAAFFGGSARRAYGLTVDGAPPPT